MSVRCGILCGRLMFNSGLLQTNDDVDCLLQSINSCSMRALPSRLTAEISTYGDSTSPPELFCTKLTEVLLILKSLCYHFRW